MRALTVVVHNIRSCHNVGALLRTADGLGATVCLTGYTPYPQQPDDTRLPHVSQKLTRQIAKTALGAEKTANWSYQADIFQLIRDLRQDGYQIVALEQAPNAVRLPNFNPPHKLALIVGREVEGIEPAVLKAADLVAVVPMFGQKESYNVVVAAAMALYHCRFAPDLKRP